MNPTPKPHVSIIAPAYNTAKFLPEAVHSVLTQSFPNFELILVDDASTDATSALGRSLAQGDPRVQFIRHETNRGLSATRNTGLKLAKGDLISFIDTDDVWETNFLEVMAGELERRGKLCAAVFCWSRWILEDGHVTKFTHTPEAGKYNLFEMLTGICPPGNGSSLLIRRQCFDEVGEFASLEVGGDAEMWLRILSNSSRKHFWCIPQFLTQYRQRQGSLVRSDYKKRIVSFEYRIQRYLSGIEPERRWEVYSAFARLGEFAGSRTAPWRKKMSRQALRSGGLRALSSNRCLELVYTSLFGWRLLDTARNILEASKGAP